MRKAEPRGGVVGVVGFSAHTRMVTISTNFERERQRIIGLKKEAV